MRAIDRQVEVRDWQLGVEDRQMRAGNWQKVHGKVRAGDRLKIAVDL